MKSRLIFRVLGALSSALIIASVFIPFISVTGYSQSLWQAHNSVGTLYLPIMIIVFGAIGVLVFSTNFKTELAYATTGALIFFLIMQTIPIINQGTFNTLSVGYYCLVIGTILDAIMAFLSSLKIKQKIEEKKVIEETKEVSMIDQIDKLYDDQTISTIENNALDNIIQPLPIQNSLNDSSNPIEVNVENNVTSIPEMPIVEDINLVQPTLNNNEQQSASLNSLDSMNSNVVSNNLVGTSNLTPTNQSNPMTSEFAAPTEQPNPVTSEFAAPTNQSNPVTSEFAAPIEQPNPVTSEFAAPTNQSNPVTSEFAAPTNQPNPVTSEFAAPTNQPNPVISEFSVPSSSSFITQPTEVVQPSIIETSTQETIQPLNSEIKMNIMSEQNNNSSNLDIFG